METPENSSKHNNIVEVFPNTKTTENINQVLELIGGIRIVKIVINLDQAAEILSDEEVRDKDLIKGKYEGGFKVWEGAVDLGNYLIEKWQIKPNQTGNELIIGKNLLKQRVLELGCGHGIPGIIAAMCGAEVHFQDFNREVLDNATQFNVRETLTSYSLPNHNIRYFAGGWDAFIEFCVANQMTAAYDFILSSETIYDADQYPIYLQCLKTLLKPPLGVAIICAKSFYFGVGGGVRQFVNYVQSDGVLTCQVVRRLDQQQGNNREIVVVKFPEVLYPYFS
eukprot:TRINITY_DN13120_c0_g2_i2.p1 TRINITY_DN13120_c0_g2~~TRINITY_DN13120_c0_g2_i2.p1  ORF type:complete len:310 (-),score=26.59 TRINITY_DN13120_c0_g2_i2:197-1036(-)